MVQTVSVDWGPGTTGNVKFPRYSIESRKDVIISLILLFMKLLVVQIKGA